VADFELGGSEHTQNYDCLKIENEHTERSQKTFDSSAPGLLAYFLLLWIESPSLESSIEKSKLSAIFMFKLPDILCALAGFTYL
jgi:hypothetical protein